MEVFLAALVALIALNVWATRLVLAAPDDAGIPKRLLVASIWLIPLGGALGAKGQLPVEAKAPEAAPRGPEDAAPHTLAGHGASDFVIADHLAVAGNIPVLDWRALDEWAHARHPGDAPAAAAAIEEGRRAWLLHLRDILGPHAHLHTTADAHILSTLEDRVLRATAKYISTARQRITRVLGDLARFPAGGRSILVVLDSEEDYYHYVSIYYPERGEFSFSGGMHIDAGCPHFVLVRADLSAAEPVIAHELTHSALAHLRLPKWLDEGLAVNTEYKVAGARRLLQTPHELHDMHLRFWNPERIQEFWSGASFDRTDDGNLLSYELARILVEQMAGQWDGFAEFVRTAERDDAGATAAQAALSIDLGAHAAALLEMDAGDAWSPRPASWWAPPPGFEEARQREAHRMKTDTEEAGTPASVDDYIAAFPDDVQAVLRQVRQAVREAAPQATEVISYRMPALRLNGILVFFAAFKKHIGFYPPITGDARLEKAAAKYAGEKGNLRFPLDEPMPIELIKGLTALRVAQDLAHAAGKAAKAAQAIEARRKKKAEQPRD